MSTYNDDEEDLFESLAQRSRRLEHLDMTGMMFLPDGFATLQDLPVLQHPELTLRMHDAAQDVLDSARLASLT
jgi:hypothetical protein